MVETYVLTFNITNSFDEWVKSYDGSIGLQKQAGINPSFVASTKRTRSKSAQ